MPDEIVDRFCLLGPAEAHIEKLHAAARLGVDQFAVYDMHDARKADASTPTAPNHPACPDPSRSPRIVTLPLPTAPPAPPPSERPPMA